MSSEVVDVERRGSVAIVRFCNPPVNAFNLEVGEQVKAALDEVLAGDSTSIVLTGAGECFSAGLDLKVVPFYDPQQQRLMIERANALLAALYRCRLPTVAALNGHAVAAGLVVALACDYRVGAETACKIGLTEARAGIPFPGAAMAIVQAELTPAAARRLVLGARNVESRQALEEGILDELLPRDRVLSRAVEVAEDLGSFPADAYRRIKHQLRAPTIERIEAMIASGADPMLGKWMGSESHGASRALLGEAGHKERDS